MIIDGKTQPGFTTAPIIELNGLSAGNTSGLTITAGSGTVKALVINRFAQNGILVQSNGGNTIQACYLGTDSTGSNSLANGLSGVRLDGSTANTVGGTAPGAGNVLSGNHEHGLLIYGASTSGNQVLGNRIGTNSAGTASLANTFDGILINFAPSNTIGGVSPEARNIISGNGRNGVLIAEPRPSSAQSFTQTVERRDRTIYFSALLNGDKENFFGAVIAGTGVDQSLSLTHLAQFDTSNFETTLEVALQGVTVTAHRVLVQLNGVSVREISFNGQEQGVSKFKAGYCNI